MKKLVVISLFMMFCVFPGIISASGEEKDNQIFQWKQYSGRQSTTFTATEPFYIHGTSSEEFATVRMKLKDSPYKGWSAEFWLGANVIQEGIKPFEPGTYEAILYSTKDKPYFAMMKKSSTRVTS